jgi:TRAP-type mannitol/chloroaromatic compound transport system permease large subunit
MLSVPILLLGPWIVLIWLKSPQVPSLALMLGLALLNTIMIAAGNLSMLLAHGENLRKQLAFYAVASLVAFTFKVIGAWQWGSAGVVWGTVVAFGFIYMPCALRLAYRTVRPGLRAA